MNPTVSIGLPVAQEPIDYIREAIRSVQNQSLTDWELIVIADGSPDITRNYLTALKDPRIRVYLRRSSLGLAARLNEIPGLAHGEFLARMDADDIMHPKRLEHQVTVLRDNPSVDLLSSRAVVIDEDKTVLGITRPAPRTVEQASMLTSTPFIHPTVIARTAWWHAHRYDAQYLRSEDKAFWIIAANDSSFLREDRVALFYRVARSLNPTKYARSARCERKIIRRFGPGIVGRVRTQRIIGWSLTKQIVIAAASKLGQEDRVTSRRYASLTDEQKRELSITLQRALAAADHDLPVFPDLDARGSSS